VILQYVVLVWLRCQLSISCNDVQSVLKKLAYFEALCVFADSVLSAGVDSGVRGFR